MPAKLLISNRDHRGWKRGDICAIISENGDFGTAQTLPNYIRLTITDINHRDAHRYQYQWKSDFELTIVSQNAQGWRLRITVDPELIDSQGNGGEVKQKVRDWITTDPLWEGANIVSFTATEVVIDCPKNGTFQTKHAFTNLQMLQYVRNHLAGDMGEQVSRGRWYFSTADVDAAVAAGGDITLTAAQAVAKLRNKTLD